MEKVEVYELWETIKQRKWLIMLLTLFAVIVTGLLSFYVIKPVYEVTATLVVQTNSTNNQIGYNDLMVNQKLVKTYSEILKSRYICDTVIQKLDLRISVKELLEKIRIKAAEDSLITSITVTDNNPGRAVEIANTFAQTFSANLKYVLKVDNVTILDMAKLSDDLEPVRPRPYLYMAVVGVLSLMAAVGLAFLLEYLDRTVKTEEQLEEIVALPVLGVIPDMRRFKAKKAQPADISGGLNENYTAENHRAENHATENHRAENYTGENYSEETCMAENPTTENRTAESHTTENYTAESHVSLST